MKVLIAKLNKKGITAKKLPSKLKIGNKSELKNIGIDVGFHENSEPGPLVDFLEGTLIPDLEESDDSMSEDFEVLVQLLKGKTRADGWSKKKFMKYLEETLIPDLRDSGKDFTADDLEDGLNMLKQGKYL